MECPNCKMAITFLAKECSYCNYQFGDTIYDKLSIYFGISNEIDHLKSLIKDFFRGIEKLGQKADLIREDIVTELKKITPPAEKGKTAVPVKDTGAKREPVKTVEALSPKPVSTKVVGAKSPDKPNEKEDTESPSFEVLLGQKWILIVGIITMVFGIGYFLKYSFDKGWIGPAGRVSLAYLWGIGFLIGGSIFQRRNYKTFGLFLMGGGIAVLYFSAFAAFQIYEFFGQTSSFGIMILVTLVSMVLSLSYNEKWLAVLGVIGGFLTPVVLSTGQDNQIALMTYISVLNLGILGVAFYKRWNLLNILGFIATYIIYTGWLLNHYVFLGTVQQLERFWPALLFLNGFYLIYSVIPFAYLFFREDKEKLISLAIVLPNSFIAFLISFYLIDDQYDNKWVSVIAIGYASMYLLMATFLYRKGRQNLQAFVILLSEASLFLVITVPLLVSNHWITIFWFVQSLALLWMGLKLKRHLLTIGAYSLLLITVLKFWVYDYTTSFLFTGDHIDGGFTYLIAVRYLTIGFLLAVSFAFPALIKRERHQTFSGSDLKDEGFFTGLWILVLFAILNTETLAFFHDYLPKASLAAISVLWAMFSIALMLKGIVSNRINLRRLALILFVLTLMKVFLFDMAQFSTPYRIVSFIIVGLILIGTSWLYYRFKGKINISITDDREKGS